MDLLAQVRDLMKAPSRIETVEGGDHSLEMTKGALKAWGETQDAVETRLVEIIGAFVTRPRRKKSLDDSPSYST